MGMGPMTGRGMGYCSGANAPGWASWSPSRGDYGRRRGGYGAGPSGGWGWRNWYHATGLPRWARWSAPPEGGYTPQYAPPSQEQELGMLRNEAEWLQDRLNEINERIQELGQE